MSHDFTSIEIGSRAELRTWLQSNHLQQDSVWLVVWKKGDARHVPASDIVEEALCFGWIDSLPRMLDAQRSKLLLSPRRIGSAWSRINKQRAERLIHDGLMTPAGLAQIEAAKRSGAWTKLDAVEMLIVPDDLSDALKQQPGATESWQAFPRSVRRSILEWIAQAKKPETRVQRIHETAEKASRNERANQWRR